MGIAARRAGPQSCAGEGQGGGGPGRAQRPFWGRVSREGSGAGLLEFLMTPEWNTKERTQERDSPSYHLCCLFTFYFDFFAFPLSLDNETRLVSFIPVSIKISFPSWFSDTCCCVLVQSPAGGVGKQAHSVPPVFLEFRAKRNSVTDAEFCLKKKEKLRGFENGGPNQGDCFLSGPDRGLCTSSCCFLLFSPCFCRAQLVRDSWGLVQGMMTEQDSLSSPVHIPAACLPFPSAHPPFLLLPHPVVR